MCCHSYRPAPGRAPTSNSSSTWPWRQRTGSRPVAPVAIGAAPHRRRGRVQCVEHDRVTAALAEQLAYYRQAAADFDRYAHAALLTEVGSRLRALVDLSGDVLEIACGAGQWTAWLAESARSLTAIDAAPEMLEFARRRLTGRLAGQVELVCADVFDWRPRRRYQAVFFAFWLSHTCHQPDSRPSGSSWRRASRPADGRPSSTTAPVRQRSK